MVVPKLTNLFQKCGNYSNHQYSRKYLFKFNNTATFEVFFANFNRTLFDLNLLQLESIYLLYLQKRKVLKSCNTPKNFNLIRWKTCSSCSNFLYDIYQDPMLDGLGREEAIQATMSYQPNLAWKRKILLELLVVEVGSLFFLNVF